MACFAILRTVVTTTYTYATVAWVSESKSSKTNNPFKLLILHSCPFEDVQAQYGHEETVVEANQIAATVQQIDEG